MGRNKKTSRESTKTFRPVMDENVREQRLISLAMDQAEEQLRNGTASSQVVTHFLKLGSSKEKIEKDILEKQKELITAKTETLKSAKDIGQMLQNAIDAFSLYSGNTHESEDDAYDKSED